MATLLDLVNLLGPDLVEVEVAPLGLDVVVGEVVVHDPLEAVSVHGGEVVLGVGLPVASVPSLWAGQPAPAAVVLKHEGPLLAGVVAESSAQGVALLRVPRTASWAGLTELAQSLAAGAAVLELATTHVASGVVEDLFAVANAVAARVDAPITIEDTQSRLLAYSALHDNVDEARAATILGHRVPAAYRAEIRRLGVAKRLLTETEPILVPTSLPGIRPRVVIALRAQGQLLGSMWAMTDGPFDEARGAAFVEAGHSVSLRLWQHRVATDLQRQQRSRTLAVVLGGGPAALEVGRRAGLEAGAYRLLAVMLRTRQAERRSHLERVRDELSMQLSAGQSATLTAELGDVVYAVLPCSPNPSQSAVEARAATERLRAGLEDDLAKEIVVARSGHCSSLVTMKQASEEVQSVLRVLTEGVVDRWDADIEEVGLQVVLHRLADLQGDRPLLRNPAVDTIALHDEQHGTDYLPTLEAHLWSFGDSAAAAARLNVHVNTFRYRLRRLGEMFDVDLADPETRFALMLQFRLGGG